MAYQYFRSFMEATYGTVGDMAAHTAYYGDFAKVAEAAIDAAQNGRIGIAKELQQQAHSLLSQTERNLNPDGWKRRLEIRMNCEIEEASR